MTKNFITKEGLEKLKNELKTLKTVKRKQVISKIQEAREHGDLTENAEYTNAKEEQAMIEDRIAELEEIIKHSVLIDKTHKKSKFVRVGSTIKVRYNGYHKEYTIVGSTEANPGEGKISNESPIGQAFLGKKKGDIVEIKVPAGRARYQIIEIS